MTQILAFQILSTPTPASASFADYDSGFSVSSDFDSYSGYSDSLDSDSNFGFPKKPDSADSDYDFTALIVSLASKW